MSETGDTIIAMAVALECGDQGMAETSDRSNRWKPRRMLSFRVSEDLEEMIKQECKRRNTDFSSFMRAAALGAMRRRTGYRGDVSS
jgi:hypothetical protein